MSEELQMCMFFLSFEGILTVSLRNPHILFIMCLNFEFLGIQNSKWGYKRNNS